MLECCNLIFRLYVQLDFLKFKAEKVTALYLEREKCLFEVFSKIPL